jgi:multisubunit Na+/H+ antiporter MnhB subunit
MVKICSRVCIFFLAMMLSIFANSQDSLKNEQPRMADALRSNGKIYVVVIVLVIILIGLFLYLVNTDKKITRLEKKVK